MATASTITMRLPEAQVLFISTCARWNGSPKLTGAMLQKHYADPEKVEQLISLGELSIVCQEVGDPTGVAGHTFGTPLPNTTLAYHRDRGDEFAPPGTGDTASEAIVDGPGGEYEEYNYLFDWGVWKVMSIRFKRPDGNPSPRFHKLDDVLASADPDNYAAP